MDIERENDLSIYQDRDAEIKNVINNSELWLSQVQKNNQKRKEQVAKVLELDDHITRIINSSYQSGDTEWLYKEFIELERFSSEIQNYINSFDKAGNKMIEIPIHP
jgi:flagellar biosynthesis component FlhA